jgi:undecaprenyl-diphosphatase
LGYAEAVLLAVLQGLTEFLPVSSSGHLVLLQQWMGGWGEVDLLFDVLLHLATAVAVLATLRREVASLLMSLFRPPRADGPFAGHERRLVGWLIVGSAPTAVIGLTVDRWLLPAVTRPDVVGAMLLVTGAVLWWGRRSRGTRDAGSLRASDALVVGALQGVAVLPGLSRSGLTITGGTLRGVDADLAARFSLLLSVPAILGATGLKAWQSLEGPLPALGPCLAGMTVAMVVGYFSIALILRLVRRGSFHWFAPYCWALGALAILWYHAC